MINVISFNLSSMRQVTSSPFIVKKLRLMEKEMATHSSILAWRISGTGVPHGLPSMGSHRVVYGDTTEAT